MKYFIPQELVSRKVFEKFREDSVELFDSRILTTIDAIREYYGLPVIVNTWLWGGNLQFRGYRAFDEDIGANRSMHHFGKAIDFTVENVKADIILKEIQAKPALFPYITRMYKVTDNTVHIDNRGERKGGKIHIIKKG